VAASVIATVKVADARPVRELIEAVRKVLDARAAGADTYEADDEIDAMEWALARLQGYADKVCSQCGSRFKPKHRNHLADVVWIEAQSG
jgi:hypothetical protein